MSTWQKSSHSAGAANCVELQWQKSSRSQGISNCVEAAAGFRKSDHSAGNGACVEAGGCTCGADVLVRDSKSKADGKGPYLSFGGSEWGKFLADVKAGRHDHGLA